MYNSLNYRVSIEVWECEQMYYVNFGKFTMWKHRAQIITNATWQMCQWYTFFASWVWDHKRHI